MASVLLAFGAGPTNAAVPAEATELYVGGGPESAVVFKVEGGHVSVLLVSADDHCGNVEKPGEEEISGGGLIAAPLPMRSDGSALTAHERGVGEFGRRRVDIAANFSEEKLVGGFSFVLDEASSRCQTGAHLGSSETWIPFEAARWVPVGSPSAASNGLEAAPIYFGDNGQIETLFASNGHHVVIRGTAASRCPVPRANLSHSTLFGEFPVAAKLGERGKFQRRSAYSPWKVQSWREFDHMTGDVSARAVTGTYRRETALHPLTDRATRCKDAPAHFRARRYVPVARRVKAPPPAYVPAAG